MTRRGRCRRGLLGLGLVLLLGGGSLACPGGEPGPGGPADRDGGAPAPDFTLESLDGETIQLSELRGKTVVIDFWATWCPPCVFQVPELNKLSAAHRERGDLAVIGVSVDIDGAEVVRPWIQEHGVEYTIVIGTMELAEKFGAVGFPTLAVVNRDGEIDSLHVGLIEYDDLEKIVAAL